MERSKQGSGISGQVAVGINQQEATFNSRESDGHGLRGLKDQQEGNYSGARLQDVTDP
jgi:hypothetical protein